MPIAKLDNGSEVFIPLVPQEITNKQYLDFIDKESAIYQKVTEDEKEYFQLALSETELELHICNAVSAICGDGVATLRFKITDGFDMEKEGYGEGMELTTRWLYYQISGLIGLLKPTYTEKDKTLEVFFKGERYVINNALTNRVAKYSLEQRKKEMQSQGIETPLTQFATYDFTTGEVVECALITQELKRLQEKNELTPNTRNILDAALCAVILRKEGEELPVNEVEREKFREQREQLFLGLDMQTVVNVTTFFLTTLEAHLMVVMQSGLIKIEKMIAGLNRQQKRSKERADKKKKQTGSGKDTATKTTSMKQSKAAGLQKVV